MAEIVNGIVLAAHESLNVVSDMIAYDTIVNGNTATVYVFNGGSSIRTEVKDGRLRVSGGGYANSSLINGSYAQMIVYANGRSENTTVKNGGTMYMSAGASATNVNIDKTGTLIMNINSNTVLTGTSHGKTVKVGDEVASNITVYAHCQMDVASKWKSYDTIVNGNTATVCVLNGGSSIRTEVKDGRLRVSGGGYANSSMINGSYAQMIVYANGRSENTTVKNGGNVYVKKGGEHRGSLSIAKGSEVNVTAGGVIDFTVSGIRASSDYLINDMSLITGTPTYTITVKDDQANGTYKLAQGAENFSGSLTIGNGTNDYGSITVNGADFVYNGVTYSLDKSGENLTLTVSGSCCSGAVDDDLDGNGLADVILINNKGGYSGAWLSTGDSSIIKWGSLSTVGSNVGILGTGRLFGSADDGQDVFFSDGKTVGAWNIVQGKVTGYKNIMSVNATTNVLGLGDFNGDGATDLLLRSTSGDLGFFGTDGSGWNYLKGLGKEWDVAAIGDLNGDGLDDTVLRHDAGFAGTFLTQADGTVKWANLDTLKSDMTIVGAGDFNGDGVDDILLQNKSNGWVGAWLVEDGSVDSFIGLCNNKNTIEQIADFNGDGIDDLRVRTASGDIGVLYVNGADDTSWQYFKGVGSEWDTSFSALA